jgi:hypothetical protein
VDKNLQFQQNLATLPAAVPVLDAPSNELQALLRLLPRLGRVLGSVKPKALAASALRLGGPPPSPVSADRRPSGPSFAEAKARSR